MTPAGKENFIMTHLKKLAPFALLIATTTPCFAENTSFYRQGILPCPSFRMMEEGIFGAAPTGKIFIQDQAEGISAEMATPGVPKEKFRIQVKNRVLYVAAESKETAETNKKENKNKAKTERRFDYHFQLPLPPEADTSKIKATYKDGILRIFIPKVQETESPVQDIAIE